MSKIFIISQARMGSSRLRGKSLMSIGNRSLLGWHITRLRQCGFAHQHIIATGNGDDNDAIAIECQQYNTGCYRGSEDDVLKRYCDALRHYEANGDDIIIRTTADCPFIDARLITQMLHDFQQSPQCDYMNIDHNRLPRGLDCEITYAKHLWTAENNSHDDYDHEHVTAYIYHNANKFHCIKHRLAQSYPTYRLCVDVIEDLQMLRQLYEYLKPLGDDFSYLNMIDILNQHPKIAAINQHIEQKKYHA